MNIFSGRLQNVWPMGQTFWSLPEKMFMGCREYFQVRRIVNSRVHVVSALTGRNWLHIKEFCTEKWKSSRTPVYMIKVGERFEDLELQLGPFETFANFYHINACEARNVEMSKLKCPFSKMSISAHTSPHFCNQMSTWAETSQHSGPKRLRCLISNAHFVAQILRCLSLNDHFPKMSIWGWTSPHFCDQMSTWAKTSQRSGPKMLRCLISNAHFVAQMLRCLSLNAHFPKTSI